ncbi:MAG TPA: ABC transporter permease [Candidatus Eisenbacteria bacterium]|nr:ABC transporter permease [Candidatus Eisenbacteria bacterium]
MAGEALLDAQRGPDGTLVVRLAGHWNLRTGLPSTRPVEDALARGPRPAAVVFDAKNLAAWDSAAVTIVERISRLCAGVGVQVRRDALPDGLKRILALAEAVPEKEGARAADTAPSLLVRLGTWAIEASAGARVAVAFVGEATLSFGRLLRGQANFRWRDLALVIQDCGADALPIVTLINFLVGLIIAFVGAVQLQKFGAGIYVADLVAIATVRELGCIMTGIIMAGRTGSGFAAELGTMNVNQEIEALSTMGVPPMDFLVLPRMLALSLMMPLLCCYADLIGILGGATVAINLLGQSPTQYWVETFGAIDLVDIGLGIGKSLIFGVLVALAGCLRGMTCGRDAAAVGQAATSAVVLGIVWIIVADGIFAVLTNILGI